MKRWLSQLARRLLQPRMVYGYRHADGRWLAHTRVSTHTRIESPATLDVGDHVFVGHFSILDASNGLRIGEGCQIGFFTGVFTHSSHVAIRMYGSDYLGTESKDAYFGAPVEIGPYSFVGAHATILPGTRIGRGSIVSAYSLVKGQFPDFAILSGNPAQVVGDTRKLDRRWLESDAKARARYEAWAGVSWRDKAAEADTDVALRAAYADQPKQDLE